MGTRFVIIATPRTGSNWLCSQLCAQPDVWCHGEVFHPKRVWIRTSTKSRVLSDEQDFEWRTIRDTDRDEFLNRVFSTSLGRPHVGFKIFPGHGKSEASKLTDDHSLQKVILFRDNFLAAYASRLAAEQTGAFSVAQMARSGRPKVQFNWERFAQHCTKYSEFYSQIFERLVDTGQAFHVVRYNEINSVPSLRALLQFIGAHTEVMSLPKPAIRGPYDILSRFSNPEVAERYLREHGLMHWAHETDAPSAA